MDVWDVEGAWSEGGPIYARMYRRGAVLRARRRFLEAALAFAQLARLWPESRAALHAGLALRQAGRGELALKVFALYARDHPADRLGWIGLGAGLAAAGRPEEAAVALGRALRLKDSALVRRGYLECLHRAGRSAEARAEGHEILKEAHRAATTAFLCSPLAKLALRPVPGRGFDPDHPGRNVISYAVPGRDGALLSGAIENARRIGRIYPGWTGWFYCAPSVPPEVRATLRAEGARVIVMARPGDRKQAAAWRLQVSDAPGVNVFLCRDVESCPTELEYLAVRQWLVSDKHFHVMRGDPRHLDLMRGGLWGGVAGRLPPIPHLLAAAEGMDGTVPGATSFVSRTVWPMIQHDVLVHDSAFGFRETRAFPCAARWPEDQPGAELPKVGAPLGKLPPWQEMVSPGPRQHRIRLGAGVGTFADATPGVTSGATSGWGTAPGMAAGVARDTAPGAAAR